MFALIGGAQAECEGATTLGALTEIASRGEQAFADLDPDGLAAAREEGLSALGCLDEAVTTKEAAAFHRLMGMHAFTTELRDMAILEFYAARKLEPGYTVPESVAPAGHPMIVLYEESVTVETGAMSLPEHPSGGWVAIDGIRGVPRGDGIPAIFQSVEASGQMGETLYLFPGDPLPERYLPKEPPPIPLAIASGVLALTSGALYWQASRAEERFQDPNTPDEDLEQYRVRTNSLVIGSMGAGLTGLGLGVYTAVNW